MKSVLAAIGSPFKGLLRSAVRPAVSLGPHTRPRVRSKPCMHFDRGFGMRLIAATALPEIGQFIRQRDRATLFTDHRVETLEQGERHRLRCLHYDGAHLL